MNDINRFRTTIAGYDGENFVENLPRICADLHNELGVLTFGIIVYDETSPELRKLLRDKDYWEALDKASGDRMVIFSLMDSIEREVDTSIGLMIAGRPSHRDKSKSYSRLVKSLFESDSLPVYPSVIFFQVFDNEIYDYRLVPLKRKDVWESAKAVQELFDAIRKVLDEVLPENYGNRREIFGLVKDELLTRDYTMYIMKGPGKISQFAGIVKTFISPFT